jgi:hypothetical protein
MQTAAAAHQARIKAAMVGNGVDRHLIGLRVLAKFTNTDTGAIFDGMSLVSGGVAPGWDSATCPFSLA